MWQVAINGLAVMAVLTLLVRQYRRASREQAESAGKVFDRLLPFIEGAAVATQAAAGTERLTGRINGRPVDIRTVTDTLALRKLPSLWLMLTLPGETGVQADLDLMMRPAGLASFSNFDRLSDTLPPLSGFPEDALIKSNDRNAAPSPEFIRPMLDAFLRARGKEILITPKGVRMVIQISEAERARYGVFRQARFNAEPLAPEIILPLVALLETMVTNLQSMQRDVDVPTDATETIRSLAHG